MATKRPEIREDPSVTSFFVNNIPGDANRMELWRLCQNLGNLVDVYIAGKRDVSGSFFAFVRFKNIQEPYAIVKALNNTEYRGRKMAANCAKASKLTKPATDIPTTTGGDLRKKQGGLVYRPVQTLARESRSYADAAMGIQPQTSTPPLLLKNITEIQSWTSSFTLIGEAKNYDDIAELKYIGGMQIVIKFKTVTATDNFKQNKNFWLKWFVDVKNYDGKAGSFERVAWIKITGIPSIAWDEVNFAAIGTSFGKVIHNHNNFWDSQDVSHAKLCILTTSRKRINEEITVIVDRVSLRIGIFEVEDDWVPFQPFADTSPPPSDDDDDIGFEDEDAILDTWQQNNMDLEEGEFNPNGEKDADGDAAVPTTMTPATEKIPVDDCLGKSNESKKTRTNASGSQQA
ncbi:hypothetical protein LXL04_025604 [Taraxacum kok-saghyz]